MEKFYRAVMKDGTHLADSKDTYGAKRGTTLYDDSDRIAGQAEFIEVDYDEIRKSGC